MHDQPIPHDTPVTVHRVAGSRIFNGGATETMTLAEALEAGRLSTDHGTTTVDCHLADQRAFEAVHHVCIADTLVRPGTPPTVRVYDPAEIEGDGDYRFEVMTGTLRQRTETGWQVIYYNDEPGDAEKTLNEALARLNRRRA